MISDSSQEHAQQPKKQNCMKKADDDSSCEHERKRLLKKLAISTKSSVNRLKTAKTFMMEQGDDEQLFEASERSAATERPRITTSLTQGFFGELTDELFSKQQRNYFKEIISQFFQSVLYEVQNLMSIMQTNKGRDRIFSLIQYIIMLYAKCMSTPNQSLSLHRVFSDSHL